MTDSQQHIAALRVQLAALQAQAVALKTRLAHSALIEVFDQSVGFPLSDVATFLGEARNASTPKWSAIWLAKAADALDDARTMLAQLEGSVAPRRDESGDVQSRPGSTEHPAHGHIATKAGDIVIHYRTASPSLYAVCKVGDDGDDVGGSGEVVAGRSDAIAKAVELVSPRGTIFLHTDDDWREINDN